MKKVYLLLTLFVAFFVSNISVKAEVKCIYTYSTQNVTITLKDGAVYSSTGTGISIKSVSDSKGILKSTCPDQIYGFMVSRYTGNSVGSQDYYLYTTSNFKNEKTYKDLKQEASGNTYISFHDDVIFNVIGDTSVKCKYTNGTVTLTTVGGKTSGSIGNQYNQASLKKLVDHDNILKRQCVSELKGFTVTYPGSTEYYLYASGEYKNTEEYKLKKEESSKPGSQASIAENVTLRYTELSADVSIPDELDCTYSNGSARIIVRNGKVYKEGNINVSQTDDFKSGMSYCRDYIYGVYFKDSSSSNDTYNLYVSDAYKLDYKFTSNNVERFELVAEEDYDNPGGSETRDGINRAGTVSCGKGTLKNLPSRLIKIINTLVSVIQIGVPVLLIIFGMIDFAKGVFAQKDDEIKKGQRTFISRLITAILVFLVIIIVKMAVRFVNEKSESSVIISCIDCFISGKCE